MGDKTTSTLHANLDLLNILKGGVAYISVDFEHFDFRREDTCGVNQRAGVFERRASRTVERERPRHYSHAHVAIFTK